MEEEHLPSKQDIEKVKKARKELFKTVAGQTGGTVEEQEEARGLLAKLGEIVSGQKSHYLKSSWSKESGRTITETGTIDEKGRRVPDES